MLISRNGLGGALVDCASVPEDMRDIRSFSINISQSYDQCLPVATYLGAVVFFVEWAGMILYRPLLKSAACARRAKAVVSTKGDRPSRDSSARCASRAASRGTAGDRSGGPVPS